MIVVQVSYGIGALAFAVLLIFALTRWRTRLRGSWIAPALAVQVLWAAELARSPDGALRASLLLEMLRCAAWLFVLARCLAASQQPARRRLLLPYLVTAGAFVAWVVLGVGPQDEQQALRAASAQVWICLALSIAGLVLVEQVARNVSDGHAWRMKFVWLAIGALFVYDLCLWSMSLAAGGFQPTLWMARGIVNALIGVLLAVGLERVAAWESGHLSPRLVFFNATLLGAGVYVLSLAAASVLVRSSGESWGAVLQVAFVAAGAMLLAVALFSGQFRAWTRVMLSKYLLPYHYDYRSEWLKLTEALAPTPGDSTRERVVDVMSAYVNSTTGGLWLAGEENEFVPAGGALAPPTAPQAAHAPFFEHLRAKEWICDLDEERSAKPQVAAPPPGWMLQDRRMWLVVPLVCEDALIGFLIIGRPPAAMRLGWEQLDLLRASARQVASHLAFEQAARRIAEMRQFEALSRLSAFMMHDLRHLIAQQALVVENAARHRRNPEFIDDAIATIDNSVKRMRRLMDQLRSGVAAEPARRVDLAEVVAEVAQRCGQRKPAPALRCTDWPVEVLANRDGLVNVIEHLVRNAQDATGESGTVTISLRRASLRAVVEVADTGVGMDREFILTRLFRPFDTTKGEQGMGLGAYEAREFARRAGGTLEVESTPGRGSTFRLILPLAPAVETVGTSATDERQAS
jgi:putative PEP-CTERM system histidine kinase